MAFRKLVRLVGQDHRHVQGVTRTPYASFPINEGL